MKKLFSFFAAMLVALVANSAVINIDNTTPDALRLALANAANDDEIVMAAGTYVESNGNYIAFDGKVVTVKAAEGAQVIIQPQVPITVSNSGHAIFENVKIDASRLTEKADWYEHLLYVTDDTPNGFTFRGCELYGFNLNKSMFYCNSTNKVAMMKFEDCYFHDIMKSIIFVENTEGKPMASVKNCTFANISTNTESYWAGVIDIRAAEATLQVDQCTFYNVIPMNTDYSCVSKITLAKGTVSNCIFMLPTPQDGIRAMRGVTATNCITFNYLKDSGTGIHSSVTQTNCIQVDPLFVDAANGNFTLSGTSPALTMNDGAPIGDPRWVPSVAPVEPQMKTIYCKMDKAWWTADNAAVGIYAWDGDVKNADWPGERMTPVEGENGLWSIELDINAYKNCIFTRVNGTGDIQDWGAKSGNLTIPTDDNDLYTITSEAAVWGDPGVAGEWSVYTPAEPTPEPVVVYNWAKDAADQIGTTIMGGNSNISIGTVKIHENTDDVDGIKFGSSYVYADGKWIAIKPAEGGFKAGDTIYTSVVFNNSDLTKYCMVDIYAADTQTRLFRSDSASTLNGRNAGEPIVQSYVLESDQDSLFLGRYGNTGMFVTLLTVVRPDAASEPTHTYTVAGAPAALFGTEWAPANTANDMREVEAAIYLFLKDSVALAAGEVTFKVVEDHSWNNAWPADDYVLKIDSNGIYHIAIYFNAVTKEIRAAADKIGDAQFGEAKYYVAGSMNGWQADAAYELVANPAQEGEYMGQFTFKNGDAFKVIKDNATGSYTWYPGGNDNNYNITQDGIYNVYFRPEGNVEGWHEGYFHVMMQNDPVVKDTVLISASEGLDWIDVVEKQGWWQIYGKNEAYSFSLSCISTTEVAGIYPVDNLDPDYSYVHPLNGTDTIHFVSGAVAVATDDTAYVAVVGELVGEDGKIYDFNLVYLLANEVYKHDEKEADFAYDFESYQSSIQNGVAIVQAVAGNESMIVLAIILPQGQSALAAGEYQVVTTPAYGTVVAGSYTDNGFMPSFAATLVEQGGQLYYNKVWYLVSGKVTIDANLNIAVDALNSASKTIKANIQAPSEGIDAVGAEKKASKSIKNGQLIIERNGVEYNATGAVIR